MVMVTNGLVNAQNAAASNLNTNSTHIAVGSGTTAPTVGDTTLETETIREANFASNVSGNVHTVDIRLDVTENNGNNQEEIGTFNAASGGTMWIRNEVTSFTKTALKESFYRVKTTFTASNP